MIMAKEKVNGKKSRAYITCLIMSLGSLLLFLLMIFSITKGAADIGINTVIEAFKNFDKNDSNQLLVMNMRLPRIIGSAFVGLALAVSGALMQGITRNPLADSGLMGLNSGSSLAIAICFAVLPGLGFSQIILMSFLGAALGSISVYVISSLVPGGNNAMKLVLAGAAVSMLMSALSQGLSIMSKSTQNLAFWTMGSVSALNWTQLKIAIPVLCVAFFIALSIARGVSVLYMGEEVAAGLGIRIKLIKILGTLAVVLLAGTSTAMAGSISFVGMLVPHLARFIVGPNYKLIIPVSGVLGPILVVAADIGAKSIKPPFEIPIGALIALIGVPVFLYYARKEKDGQ